MVGHLCAKNKRLLHDKPQPAGKIQRTSPGSLSNQESFEQWLQEEAAKSPSTRNENIDAEEQIALVREQIRLAQLKRRLTP